MVRWLRPAGKGNDQSKLVVGCRLGIGVRKVKNQLSWRGRGTGKNEEKGNDPLRDGGDDPVLVGNVVVGPFGLPGGGVEEGGGLVGIFEHVSVALLAPQAKVLVVGRQIKNVLPKMDPERPGALVLNFDGKEDVCDAVPLLDGRSLGLECQRRVGPDGAGRQEIKTHHKKDETRPCIKRQGHRDFFPE